MRSHSQTIAHHASMSAARAGLLASGGGTSPPAAWCRRSGSPRCRRSACPACPAAAPAGAPLGRCRAGSRAGCSTAGRQSVLASPIHGWSSASVLGSGTRPQGPGPHGGSAPHPAEARAAGVRGSGSFVSAVSAATEGGHARGPCSRRPAHPSQPSRNWRLKGLDTSRYSCRVGTKLATSKSCDSATMSCRRERGW